MRTRRTETVLRISGGVALAVAVLLVFPIAGEGAGDSHDPGADTMRWLSFQHPVHVLALALAVFGIITLMTAWILDTRQ